VSVLCWAEFTAALGQVDGSGLSARCTAARGAVLEAAAAAAGLPHSSSAVAMTAVGDRESVYDAM
jgi:hypothetical protein